MCALCGIPTHVAEPTPTPPKTPARARFAAFKNPHCRTYIVGASLSMGGDSIEHVISYWVLFQQFHSPALAGFAVISHWVPSLFGVYFGALADRYDCRKIIQAAQLLFMSVSAIWGVLFITNSLQMWHAMVLRAPATPATCATAVNRRKARACRRWRRCASCARWPASRCSSAWLHWAA